MSRNRILTIFVGLVLTTSHVGVARADKTSCREKATKIASSMYSTAAKQFLKCSQSLAGGDSCSETYRDAVVQAKLTQAQIKLLSACEDSVATQFGFLSGDSLALRVAGIATAEGRQVADAVYGREPSTMSSSTLGKCAKQIAKQIASAGKKAIKINMVCSTTCPFSDTLKVSALYAKAKTKIASSCLASDLMTLIGSTDASSFVDTMKTNVQRVVSSLTPGSNPSISVVQPANNSTLSPGGLPISLATSVAVTNAPHAGYVVSVRTGEGINTGYSSYNSSTGRFDRDIVLSSVADANYNLPVQLRSYLGTFNTSSTVKFNLGNVAPDVVINGPVSGAITNATSVTVSGQIIGDISKASVLLVNGVPTSFNSGDGSFSTNVSLTSDSVQIVDAVVQAFSVGTENSDSVVVLKGTAVPMDTKIASANHNRFNNSGFSAVKGAIVGPLATGLSSGIIGQQFNGGTVTEFSSGTLTTQIGAVGANSVQIIVGIPQFHLKVVGIQQSILSCDLTDDASLVQLTYTANLEPLPPLGNGMVTIPTATNVQFFNNNPSLSGSIGLCSLAPLLVDLNGLIEDGFQSGLGDQLATQINTALAGIDIAGPIGGAVGVTIDSNYESIVEDSIGVTFNVASNVINPNPVPGAPNITETLDSVQTGPPVFGPAVPGTSTNFDLSFCLSEGFLNRFMAALMMAGQFNQSINEIPATGGGAPIAVTTDTLSALFADDSYTNACPGCNVTISVAPTVAAVARAPHVGENADVILVVPNYRMTAVASDSGSPMPLISADVTFSVGIKLGADGAVISPTIGDPAVQSFKVVSNSIDADEGALATGVVGLFSQFASGLAGLFTSISLPPFELTPGQPANIYALGSGWNVSCAGLYLGFTPPPTKSPTATPTVTRTSTITATPTVTPPVPNTPTQTATRTPTPAQTNTVTPGGSPAIGTHTLTLASGSKVQLQGALGLPLNISGSLTIQFGAPNSSGVAPVVLDKADAHFNSVTFAGRTICVGLAATATGYIDCDGGTSGRDIGAKIDHNTTPGSATNGGSALGLPDDQECDDTRTLPNGEISTACMEGTSCTTNSLSTHGVCNSPTQYTESGVMGAGDMRLLAPVQITQLASSAEFGPDNTACTSDDTPSSPGGATTVYLTTGTAKVQIFDANNVAGAEMGPGKTCGGSPCQAQVSGATINCENLRTSNSFGGGKIVGGFGALDTDATLKDLITLLTIQAP